MPTGYTAAILDDDIDFNTFAMNCARAFGACIMLRDEPGGGEVIPDEFKPSTYHSEAIAKAKADLAAATSMTVEECAIKAQEEWEAAEKYRTEGLATAKQNIARLQAMQFKIEAWKPPTSDHENFKAFMLEQVESTMKQDGKWSLEYHSKPNVKKSPEQWRQQAIESAVRDISYHEKAHSEEVMRTNGRTEWVRQLRKSLTPTT